jgi:hypothetical protein
MGQCEGNNQVFSRVTLKGSSIGRQGDTQASPVDEQVKRTRQASMNQGDESNDITKELSKLEECC